MKIEVPKILERFGGTQLTNIRRIIDNALSKVHTNTIGIIESFDPETQTATIQPAIKRVIMTENKETITYNTNNYPLLVNVPIVFQGGGDWFITFPVKKGDECIIFSMERSISKWKVNGGIQEPGDLKRKLSFKDAVAMVGIQSKASALPNFNADEPEFRNRDGDVLLKLTSSGIVLYSDADNAVRYSALETAYNQLKTDFDNLVTIFNAHVHPDPTSGSTGITPTPGTPSTGDITGAKVDEIKVP